jgi:polar amino acid transport system permease protein
MTVVAIAAVCAGLIGMVVALMQVSGQRWLMRGGQAFVTLFRNIPLLIQLFFWYFGISMLFPRSAYPFIYTSNYEITIAVLTISLVSGAFIAEVLRSGIEAVPSHQMEAALATGLTRGQGFYHVVVPQLWPIAIPGLANEAINVVKNSAFAMTIGVTELIWQAQQIEANTFRGFEAMTIVTIVYLTVNGVIFVTFRALEHLVRAR